MSNQDIFQRIEDLHNVLVYCSDMQAAGRIHVFKVGERICINQERGALLTQLAHNGNEVFLHEVRDYKVSPAIEAKIKLTNEKINATNWSGFSKDKFLKPKKIK
jgi:hypothetical protein